MDDNKGLNMKKILFNVVFFMFFAHSVVAQATNLFRVVVPSAIPPGIEVQIKQGLEEAVSGRDIQIILHKAETTAADSAMFARVLKLPSAGIITALHHPDWGVPWAERLMQTRSGSQPLLSIGFMSSIAGFDAQIGARVQDYTDLAAQFLNNTQGDTLCLFSLSRQWCDMLTASTRNTVISRSVATDQTISMQMAATVSAMTQNPNITQILASDLAILPGLQQALKIIGGTFILGGIGDGSETGLDWSIEPQWLLQTVLAVNALEVQARHGQALTGTIRMTPLNSP